MGAAASGHSTLGIPKKVGKEFINKDPGGKLPTKKGENGVAGGEPPGIDAQTNMSMAEGDDEVSRTVSDIKTGYKKLHRIKGSMDRADLKHGAAWSPKAKEIHATKYKPAQTELDAHHTKLKGLGHEYSVLSGTATPISKAEGSTSTSNSNGSHSVSVSESSGGDVEVRSRQTIKKDEDLDDQDTYTHRAKIKGKVPMRRKQNPETAPNNTVTAPETEGRTGMSDGSGFIKPTTESLKGASDAINKDELGKAGTNRTMPSSTLDEKLGNYLDKDRAKNGTSRPMDDHEMPSVARKFAARNYKDSAIDAPSHLERADSFPHDANNPLLDSYKKPNRLQQIQKADPMWLSEKFEKAGTNRTMPSSTTGEKAGHQEKTQQPRLENFMNKNPALLPNGKDYGVPSPAIREEKGRLGKAGLGGTPAPATPAPAKPTSPPTPKALKVPQMQTMTKSNVAGLRKGSKVGTPKGDMAQASFAAAQQQEPKIKLPSAAEHEQRAASLQEFIPAGKFGKK